MTQHFPSLDEIKQIFTLQHVENVESTKGFYFNCGTVTSVSGLIEELQRDGVDPTVLCFTPPHDPQNCYYTPKNAKMGKGRWVPDVDNTAQ